MISERLELVPATIDLCRAETLGREALARALAVRVPDSWPPPVFEPDDVERIRLRLERDPSAQAWTLHYIVLRTEPVPGGPRDLLGVAGVRGLSFHRRHSRDRIRDRGGAPAAGIRHRGGGGSSGPGGCCA